MIARSTIFLFMFLPFMLGFYTALTVFHSVKIGVGIMLLGMIVALFGLLKRGLWRLLRASLPIIWFGAGGAVATSGDVAEAAAIGVVAAVASLIIFDYVEV